MKKPFLKVAVPTLAFGLAFAPLASAANNAITVKTTVQQTEKEKEGTKRLTSITKDVSKVEANITLLTKVTADFYAKTAPVSSKTEANFYKIISGKFKADAHLLKFLKDETDKAAKKIGNTEATAAVYAKITAQNDALAAANKKLSDLHTAFQTKAKETEASTLLASINKPISKVETNDTQTFKAIADFYAKAALGTVSARAEANFFVSASDKLKDNTKLLKFLNKELDLYSKKFGKTDAVKAASAKITAQNDAIAVNSKTLADLHTQFAVKAKENDAKKRFATISTNVSKVEARVSALSKAATEFYAGAGTASVTAGEEAEFYYIVSGQFKASSNQLAGLKKELDEAAKRFGKTDATVALDAKITAQNEAIALASKNVADLHVNFKPVVTTTH